MLRFEAVLSRRSILLVSIVLACGERSEPPETGIDLTIAWDSTMGVERLVVWGTTGEGVTRINQQTIEAPYSIDPPGLRVAPIDLVLEEPLEGEMVTVRVDGRAMDGHVVGSGATSVAIEIDRLVSAQVTLGPPVTCGDGRTSTLEACDDGNAIAGDGCSEVCAVEPGHTCIGSPSICGRCGDGVATGGEECDDNNNADGDGCSSTCMLEVQGELMYEVERPEPAMTTSTEFVDVPGATLSFVPNSPNDRWIVFASGVLGSSDPSEVSAEMRILVNGIEVDRFGHQTLGAEDNEAGFVTFEMITGASEEQVITPQIRAAAGTTRVKNLRVVAALIPPGADFQYVNDDEVLEIAGDELELLRLDFTPSRAGDYVVLAKGNLTEEPSGSTAQLWLQDELGRSAVFSSPRDALVPAFIASVRPLDVSPKSFVLRGRSSSSAMPADWWDTAFPLRQVVNVIAPANGLPAGHPIAVTFDHASQVAAGRSLPSGGDVFVVARMEDGTLVPIYRVADESYGWNRSDTRIWFRTVAGVTPEYWIYWGAIDAERAPPSNPNNVFSFFDRFDGTELDARRWTAVGAGGVVQNGQLVLGPLGGVVGAQSFGIDTIWEAQVTLTAMAQLSGVLEIWTAGTQVGDSATGFRASADQGVYASTTLTTMTIPLVDPFSPHVVGFVRRAAEVAFQIDGRTLFSLPDQAISAAAVAPVMANGDANVMMAYDWVRVRSILPEEPKVEVGAIESQIGYIPSRFSHRKLMAFRTDVFARARHTASVDPVSTTSPDPIEIAKLEVEPPSAETRELLIAAARISGASSATGRKSGEVLANGEVLLRTAHKIDRDSSRANGYHHVAGVVDGRLTKTSTTPASYEIRASSPDGIQVDATGASLILLSYPARP